MLQIQLVRIVPHHLFLPLKIRFTLQLQFPRVVSRQLFLSLKIRFPDIGALRLKLLRLFPMLLSLFGKPIPVPILFFPTLLSLFGKPLPVPILLGRFFPTLLSHFGKPIPVPILHGRFLLRDLRDKF